MSDDWDDRELDPSRRRKAGTWGMSLFGVLVFVMLAMGGLLVIGYLILMWIAMSGFGSNK